ncbi:hypothetical protein [Rubritalea tangerina]|uniref:hypothetical protein n=1 Tax=Rubritalea tangerina TaxID=430798 RepID=UPI0036143336
MRQRISVASKKNHRKSTQFSRRPIYTTPFSPKIGKSGHPLSRFTNKNTEQY